MWKAGAPGDSAVSLGLGDRDTVALRGVRVAVAELAEGADLSGVRKGPADLAGPVVVLHSVGGHVVAADRATGEVVDERYVG